MPAPPTLSPVSQVSAIRLPETGSADDVAAVLPFGMYAASTDFHQALPLKLHIPTRSWVAMFWTLNCPKGMCLLLTKRLF